MFGILAKFFRFSGRENGNKFKLSIVIGLVEALASAMKIPAIMYILIGLLSGKPIGKYIGGSIAIMVIAIVVDVICKRYSTVLQTEGGYNASAFMRIKIAEHELEGLNLAREDEQICLLYYQVFVGMLEININSAEVLYKQKEETINE